MLSISRLSWVLLILFGSVICVTGCCVMFLNSIMRLTQAWTSHWRTSLHFTTELTQSHVKGQRKHCNKIKKYISFGLLGWSYVIIYAFKDTFCCRIGLHSQQNGRNRKASIHYLGKKCGQLYYYLLCYIFVDISSQIKLIKLCRLNCSFSFQSILNSSFLCLVCDILSQSD